MRCRERISRATAALLAQRGSRGIALLAAFATAAVAAALAPFVAYGAGARPHRLPARPWSGGNYGWPVKPFHRQHPVRGNFGDPRTIFAAPPTSRALLNGSVLSHFHYGIDICSWRGTAVYPVRAGVVTGVSGEHGLERVTVASQAGRTFVYTHVVPAVAVGQTVDAETTV